MKVKAVVFDMDDTLYPEREYLIDGFQKVGAYLDRRFGRQDGAQRLLTLFDRDKKDVYGRFLREIGARDDADTINEMIDLYRKNRPQTLHFYDDVEPLFQRLRDMGLKIGVISDGDPFTQQAKVDALGLEKLVDCVILTDTLGGETYRKPHPLAFELMAQKLGVAPCETIYVGDNPSKDFAISAVLPIDTYEIVRPQKIHDCTQYRDGILPKRKLGSLSALIDAIEEDAADEDAASRASCAPTNGGETMEQETYEQYVHRKLLQALKFFHGVCEKENIKYSLYAGTLIGAIRHKGFIPWDDDVDVLMHRAEFDKLCAVIGKYIDNEDENCQYFFQHSGDRVPEVNFRKPLTYGGKELGYQGVDIYLIDNMPDSAAARAWFVFRLKIMQGEMKKGNIKWEKYTTRQKLLVRATRMMGAGRSLKRICKNYERYSQKYNAKETSCKLVSNDNYAIVGHPYPKKLFETYHMTPFEDTELMVFDCYDEILRVQYGDYMQLPPESERHFIHAV